MKIDMRNVFKDRAVHEEFEANGFVVLPIFPTDELDQVERVFERYFPEIPPAFFSSSYLKDFDLKKQISDELTTIISPHLKKHFKDYRCMGAAFLTKAPDKNSELPLHQDWSTVDESEYLAANIWTPISAITTENGTLEVIPGSHKVFRSLRAPTLPFSGKDIKDELRKRLVPIFIERGSAVVLDQALVHCSGPNLSRSPRLAFTSGLISADAPLRFHHWDEKTSELETFMVDDDFPFRWQNFHTDIFLRPQFGKSIGKRNYKPSLYTANWIEETLPELGS